jgi:hypothetical protein
MRSSTAHIVYCEERMLLDKGPYLSWHDVQDAYPDYKTSLGPWSETEIVEFLRDDWGAEESPWPFSRTSIAEFFRSEERVLPQRITHASDLPARKPFRVLAALLGSLMLIEAVLLAFFRLQAWGDIALLLVGGVGFATVAVTGYWVSFRRRPRT